MSNQKKKIVGRVTPDVHEKLLQISASAGVSQSVILSVAIEEVYKKIQDAPRKIKSAKV